MDNGLFTGAVFIDLKKAFDTIDHRILLNKLQRCRVCDRTLLWFSSYFQGRSQRVEVDKALSSSLVIASSVPQGSILGTLLFILYINDALSYLFLTVLFFAAKTATEFEASLNTITNRISLRMQENKLF